MNDHKNLFVYGTLKMGGRLHDFYLKNQTFMGTFHTEPNYVMVDLGSFPIIFPVKKGTGQKIEGEIYEVDDLHFKTVQTMEEGAGYDTTTDIFLSKAGAIHRMASIFSYPTEYFKGKIENKKGVVSWGN